MHEYSIVQSLYDSVVSQVAARGGTGVHAVHLKIGELSGVDVGLLDTAWKTFRVHTICEAAPVEITVVAPRWTCASCGTDETRGAVLRCRTCGGAMRLAAGDEIVLERIVMEVP
jgi:hydrogenase nickel incorporation protein HypA/HybF